MLRANERDARADAAALDRLPRLGDLPLEVYLNDPARRQSFVTPMFDRIAARYDTFTRLFSFGMDAGWKRAAIAAVRREVPDARHALDLACGTGDLTVGVARVLADARVVGLDASPGMVATARQRHRDESRVHMARGDMMALGIRDGAMDVITVGYGVRNVPVARTAVQEMARVLRSGGVLVTLDFFRPQFAPWRFAFLRYLSIAGNAVGWWWYRDPVVYGYIARSVEHFMSWQAFSLLLESEGFEVRRVERHLAGGIAMHVAIRRAH